MLSKEQILEEDDDVVYFKINKFEDKMKNAEDRYLEK